MAIGAVMLILLMVLFFIWPLIRKKDGQLKSITENEQMKAQPSSAPIGREDDYIRRLVELSGKIDDEKIWGQINHLIKCSRQIFDFVSANPNQRRKINTFMDYYYPTALKFLENYAELSSRSVKGENINSLLEKISASLISIETAFEHQVDSLYYDKVLDIKTDIAVLENIMERQGMGQDARMED